MNSNEAIIADLEKDIENLGAKYAEVKNRLQSLNCDVKLKQLLELRYFNGLMTKEVATRIAYSKRYTERLHNKAIKLVEQSLKQDGIKL